MENEKGVWLQLGKGALVAHPHLPPGLLTFENEDAGGTVFFLNSAVFAKLIADKS